MIGLGLSITKAAVLGQRSLLSSATSQLGGIAPYHYWDFLNDRALFAAADVGGVASTPNWSFSRASSGYAQKADGTLQSFASGALRRTDKGVLIEGARTNLATYSQDLSNAAWTATAASKVAGYTAPDGTTTAYALIENTATSGHEVAHSNNTITTAVHTVTFYAKAAGRTRFRIYIASMNNVVAFYQLSGAGSVDNVSGGTSVTTSITALANGWYRCTLTDTATVANIGPLWSMASTGTTISYTGDNTSGIVLWGYQVELASFPSSYIPTTTASATRAADVLTVSSPGVSYPLTLFAEFERVVDTGTAEIVLIVDDGTAANFADIYVNVSDLVQADIYTSSVQQSGVTVSGAVPLATATKSAGRFAANNAQAAKNGTLGTQDSSVTAPTSPTAVRFGVAVSGFPSFGYLRRAAIFNSAVNDAGLQAMTA